jgi:hypothetical protein
MRDSPAIVHRRCITSLALFKRVLRSSDKSCISSALSALGTSA